MSARLRPSIGLEMSIGEFFYLNVENLQTYHKQARKHFDQDELHQLAETIREHGIRQPLSVIKTAEPGVYQVISGERRLRAAKMAGLDKVPCIILADENHAEEVAVIENIQRADLHPLELAAAYSSLLRDFNHGDQAVLAKKLSVSNSHISETLALNKLPQEIKDYLISKNIRTRATLRKLISFENIEQMKHSLGMDKTSRKVGGKRKFVFTFFIKNGEVGCQTNNYKLTDRQKEKIKEHLQNIIENF